MNDYEKIAQKWEEIKYLVESMDRDVQKEMRGNLTAGIRARKGLRLLRDFAHEMCKESLEQDKLYKAERKSRKNGGDGVSTG